MLIVRLIWFVILIMSVVELIICWNDWFKCEKKSVAKVAGQYSKLTIKCILPGILAIFGVLCAFYHE